MSARVHRDPPSNPSNRPERVLLVFAAFSRFDAVLDRVPDLIAEGFEPVLQSSERFAFTETDYYAGPMGAPLSKQLFACGTLRDPASLAEVKRRANAIEAAVAREGNYPVQRPLNLDPGFLSSGKFLLASTKDHAHRVYIGADIYAEVTLHLRGGQWQPWPWTYPDYRRPEVHAFLSRAREAYRTLLR